MSGADRQQDAQQPGVTWDEEQTSRWLAQSGQREAQLAPVAVALFERAEIRPGMNVLDVGCGTGPTTREAARRARPGGRVIGVDVSPGMIEAARTETEANDIEWLVADAQEHQFLPASFDAIISRFGVMFFSDPGLAFRNLARAHRPGGRLVMAVWPERDRTEFFSAPLQLAIRALDRVGAAYTVPPAVGGPFSLGNAQATTRLLEGAGWEQVKVTQEQRLLYRGGPGASTEQAVESVLGLGPVRLLLQDQPPSAVEVVQAELYDDFLRRRDEVGVAVPGGFLIVEATRANA